MMRLLGKRRGQRADGGTALVRRLVRSLMGAFAAAGAVTLFVNVGMLFVPLYDMILYDRVLQSRNMDTVTMLTIGVAVGMTIFGVLEFCRSLIFMAIADRLGRRLNLPAIKAAIAKSIGGDASAAGQAMRDVNELRLFASGSSAALPLDLLWTPALIAVLFLLHPVYGIYGLVCASLLFVISLANDLATRADLKRSNDENAKCLNDLSSALRNTELLDGLGMLPAVARRWQRRQGEVMDRLSRANRRAKAFAATAKTARLLMQAGVIGIGVTLVMRYEASPGSMMGSNLLIAKLLLPFELLVSGWRQWVSALAAWQRVRDLVEGDPADRRTHAGGAEADAPLVVERLGFAPEGAVRPVLDGISFSVAAGEAVGILGPSGSGKSTLARLVSGVLQPTSGVVRVDGVPVPDWDRAAFGRRVGYLPQSVVLLDGTIMENISRFEDEAPAVAVDAATGAGVHDLIGRLPEGYATWIGGNGYALSGGQRQRVALARALYGNPGILILDEPNANLDHDGELALVETVRAAKRAGAAVLLITHRPTILKAVDRVITVQDGRIAPDAPNAAEVVVSPVSEGEISAGATVQLA